MSHDSRGLNTTDELEQFNGSGVSGMEVEVEVKTLTQVSHKCRHPPEGGSAGLCPSSCRPPQITGPCGVAIVPKAVKCPKT